MQRDREPLNLNEAVRLWKHANHCDGESASAQPAAQACPRPIIVAAAGGASRAGFFTASVLGQLLDHRLPTQAGAPGWAGQRLFAFSTVSGSSVAAVMSVAAMAASPDQNQPCRSRAGQLWFGVGTPFDSHRNDRAGQYLQPERALPLSGAGRRLPYFCERVPLSRFAAGRRSSQKPGSAKCCSDAARRAAEHGGAQLCAFPLISPPGEIYDADNHVVDRMVDGGYFENFGAQTATELAEAIVAIDHNLRPFVLVLSNDPTVPELENLQGGANPHQAERAEEGAWITDVSGPVKAFIHTRNARGVLAVDSMPAALARGHPHSCNVVQLRVWYERKTALEARAISMSWWLSKPVQLYLHQQASFGPDRRVHETKKSLDLNGLAVKNLVRALDEPPSAPEERRLAASRKGLSVERITAGPQGAGCDDTTTTSAQR